MNNSIWKLLLSTAACAVLLSGCVTDGVSFSGGSGGGIIGGGSGGGSGGGGSGGGGSGGGGSGGGGSGGGGSGGGGSGGGSGGNSASAGLGDGALTITAGGTTISTPALLASNGPVGSVTAPIVSAADSLISAGNAALPLAPVAEAVAPVTSILPVTAKISNTQLSGGSETQPIGIGILSDKPAEGTLASVNLGTNGQTLAVTLLGSGTDSLPAGNGAISKVTETATGLLNGLTGSGPGLLNGENSLLNLSAKDTKLISGDNPLLGASLLSQQQDHGSLLSVGVQSGGEPATLEVGGKSVLPQTIN